MNYFKKFIPGFHALFRPIRALLSRSDPGIWTEQCHKLLGVMCEILARRLELAIVRPGEPFCLYVAVNPEGVGCILCQ